MRRITVALERIAHALETEFEVGTTNLNFESLDPDKFVEKMDRLWEPDRNRETTQPEIQIPLSKPKKPNGL